MTVPFIGSVDPLAIAAVGFLLAVIATTIGLFVWISRQQGGRGGRTPAP